MRQRARPATSWARIEARSYEDALQLLERLDGRPSTLVQLGEREWSLYVTADAPEVPELVFGCGIAPGRVAFIGGDDGFGGLAALFDDAKLFADEGVAHRDTR
jgi:hypothetical protein